MVVCFCLNDLGAFGLGATLTSLIKNCSDSAKLKLYFLCSDVSRQIKNAILTLLQESNFKGEHLFADFYPDTIFKNYRSLQGDRTTYGRLLISDFMEGYPRVLYLDSDLIIETDVLKLEDIDLNDKAIGGVGGSDLRYNLEQQFYLHVLNLPPATTSFNAGVLIINIPVWKKQAIKERLLQFANKYPNELLAADQTLLNGFFAGDFCHLPSNYNNLWYATSKPKNNNGSIYHFVGSPKPWDLFGKYLHTGYKKWKQYSTENWEQNVLHKHKTAQLKRWWHIRRSYLKLLLKK